MLDDDENLCRYGTPLDPLDEDEIPSKKPIAIEDQIVKDSNGRRRFHGAFTGGFSAGFWNTVGSLEGWRPAEFKSSRSEKVGLKAQRPEDFMDEEDLGEFGIAPQRIQATEEFVQPSTSGEKPSGKRKFERPSDGPIPGVPVLHQLLKPAKENVAIRILKSMGWKDGQGIGARQTRKEKKAAREHNRRELYLQEKYGCDLPFTSRNDEEDDDDSDSDLSNTELTFAPDDYVEILVGVKDNVFGLGYVGLSREPVLKNQKHINLFNNFEVVDRHNKKLSIGGQAFGVGALEEDDDDIYARDDLTKYDFSLGDKRQRSKKAIESAVTDKNVIEGFTAGPGRYAEDKEIFIVDVPAGFRPRNWANRKSRFEPLPKEVEKGLRQREEYKKKGLGRHDLTPKERGNILESGSTEKAPVEPKPSIWDQINAKTFTKGELLNENVEEEHQRVKDQAKKLTENLETADGVFKPFISDTSKQDRYEKFLEFNDSSRTVDDFLSSIQPLHFTQFERNMEKSEFIQAKKLYKPLRGLMSDRFITEADVVRHTIEEKSKPAAADIAMVREKCSWKPHATLCKRFNVPDPSGGAPDESRHKSKKKSNFSVFDYLETNLNDRKSFVTPQIIPAKEKGKNEEGPSTSKVERKPSPPPPPPVVVVEAKLKETMTVKPRKQEPRTDLEKRIDDTRFVHPSAKIDLFKAIFESSDEEDDIEIVPEAGLRQDVIDSILTKSASEINILRNNSPPRGIFANLFTKNVDIPIQEPEVAETVQIPMTDEMPSTSKDIPVVRQVREPLVKFRSRVERLGDVETISVSLTQPQPTDDDQMLFGPKPPPSVSAKPIEIEVSRSKSSKSDERLERKLEKLLRKTGHVEEVWVEKDKSKKKRKKSKDHKEKHKKHKKDKKNKKEKK